MGATARAWTIPGPNGAMLTLSTAAAKIWSTQQGFPTIPGHTRLVLPLLFINLLMLLIINQLSFLITNQLSFLITKLSNHLITSLPMPVMSSLPILVTITMLVTTRDLGILSTLSNHQVETGFI